MKNIIATAIIGAAMTGGVLLAQGTAHADTTDDAFLATLQAQGIVNDGGDARSIKSAHDLCMLRADGMTNEEVITFIFNNSGLNIYNSGYLLGAAEAAYCPKYLPGGTLEQPRHQAV